MRRRKLNDKRLSPYSKTAIWEKDELQFIIKYENSTRNKAILVLLWDLNARNHEITLLRINNIQIKEKYGEGEVPYEAKLDQDLYCSHYHFHGVSNIIIKIANNNNII